MKNLLDLDRETRFETLKAIKENRVALVDCFRTTYEGTPADTVKALVDRIGYNAAIATVAELVNSVGDWDGRIYDYVRAWAHSVETAATRDEMETYHIYQPSEIHPAHINQIGQAMREYTPEETANQTTETEETTTEQEENTMTIIEAIRKALESRTDRSAWDKGVTGYALEILDTVEQRATEEGHEPTDTWELYDFMLNGAKDYNHPTDTFRSWSVASWGGSYEIYDTEIAKRLCTPSELKKTHNGERRPNSRENWLDVQARALYQAGRLIAREFDNATTKEG